MRQSNYSPTEVEHMLESVREYLPVSGLEWGLVAQCHMRFHPDLEHTGDQLKKKLNKLTKTKMGTGDPTMLPDVCGAKEIRGLIIKKSEGVTGSEDKPIALDDVLEDDNEEEHTDNGTEEDCCGAVGAARTDGSVAATVRGRGGGTVVGGRGGSSVSSVSPNQGVSYD